MENPIFIGLVSWLFPGGGHLVQKRLKRGVLISVSIWVMYVVGLLSGGAYYPGFELKDGMLLYILDVFAKAGNGLGAAISFFFSLRPSPDEAARATFEYGGRFLETAGLLNFLAIIDAIDIALGRKK